jgi:threonine dehydratase
VFVPIGGGGMIAGVASGLRALGHKAVIAGVEPVGAAVMHRSLANGRPTDHEGPPRTIADGLAYPFGGRYTYPIVRDLVQRVALVEDAEIRAAMLALMLRAKLYAEPSAAAGLAGLVKHRAALADAFGPIRKAVIVVSGGNLDPERLKDLL